jgi:hypothetical protein
MLTPFGIAAFSACWTLAVLVAGVSIGWRMRGGQPPLPAIPNPFAKKPEPKEPIKPKPQANI